MLDTKHSRSGAHKDRKSKRESERCHYNGYWRRPSCSKSGRPVPAGADTSNSAKEPARSIAATDNRIPEVQWTSLARNRPGPHRIFEFGELSRIR